MKVAIIGAAGRMGRKLIELSEKTDFDVVSKVDCVEGYARDWAPGVQGVIDFSYHACVPGFVEKAANEGLAYVIGTTGLTADEQAVVARAAERIPVVQSGNYSLGVNLLAACVRKAASVLDASYDIEITETHHRHKKDAPSGTALLLADAAAKARGVALADCAVFGRHGEVGERPQGEIAIHALRGGSVVGDHTVMFLGELERIELTHKAHDRAAFAAGAFQALRWASRQRPGLYSMQDVLGFAS